MTITISLSIILSIVSIVISLASFFYTRKSVNEYLLMKAIEHKDYLISRTTFSEDEIKEIMFAQYGKVIAKKLYPAK